VPTTGPAINSSITLHPGAGHVPFLGRPRRAAFTFVTIRLLVALSLGTLATPSHAEWRRTSDIDLNTAYTLEEGSLSIGIFAPLSVGVTENFQASIHPLLLLLGQPSLAFRLRLTTIDDVTVALNLAGAWSFIEREDEDGVTSQTAGERYGFPGTLQLTQTTTIRLGRSALISLGSGITADFLGERPIRGMLELHLSAHLVPASRHLLMLQLIGFIPFTEAVELIRPTAQFIYAWSATSRIDLAVGLGLGDWTWEDSTGRRTSLRIFPVLDVWFRF